MLIYAKVFQNYQTVLWILVLFFYFGEAWNVHVKSISTHSGGGGNPFKSKKDRL